MIGANAASARCAHALAHLLAMVLKVPQSLIGLPYDRFLPEEHPHADVPH